MKYAYFPGCSLEATGIAYEESVKAVAGPMGMVLEEIPDWNCCGATAYLSVNEVLSFCLSARNLAQAAKTGNPVVTACNACFTNLRKTEAYLSEFPELKRKVDLALAEGGLRYEGGIVAKHFLQAIVEDVGWETVRSMVKTPLNGLRVAPYYGCQIARPYGIEDDKDNPMLLDRLIDTLGATPVAYPMKTVCCGGSLMGTREEVALRLCRNLLMCAQQDRADCIAVLCPLCQINLDAFQNQINKAYGTDFHIPILYFTQLVGLAFGISPITLGFQRGVVSTNSISARFAKEAR